MPNRVVHFEIHASEPERLIEFYTNVFGWSLPKWMDEPAYWGVMTGPADSSELGINGGLMQRHGGSPAEGAPVNTYACTVQVEDYDAIHAKILANGGVVGVPKHAIPTVAWQGYYKDPDGNIFGVHQPDPDAK
jgi:predicted enzyme related to lactoylglutathione lyase